MKSLAAAVIAAGLSLGFGIQSNAAEQPTLGVRVDEVHTAINDFYKQSGLRDRVVKTECGEGKAAVCQYSMGRAVRILASASRAKAPAREVLVVFGVEKPDHQASLQALGVYAALIAKLSPSADLKERGAVLSTLMAGISGKGDEARAELGSVRYKISAVEGMGIWFIAAPVK